MMGNLDRAGKSVWTDRGSGADRDFSCFKNAQVAICFKLRFGILNQQSKNTSCITHQACDILYIYLYIKNTIGVGL